LSQSHRRCSHMNPSKQTPIPRPPNPARVGKGSPERPGPVRPRCVCVYAHRSQSVPDTVFMTRTFPRRRTSLPGTIPDRTASFPPDVAIRRARARTPQAMSFLQSSNAAFPPGAASFSEVPAARPERTIWPSFFHVVLARILIAWMSSERKARWETIAPLCTGKPDRRPARACHKGPADA